LRLYSKDRAEKSRVPMICDEPANSFRSLGKRIHTVKENVAWHLIDS